MSTAASGMMLQGSSRRMSWREHRLGARTDGVAGPTDLMRSGMNEVRAIVLIVSQLLEAREV